MYSGVNNGSHSSVKFKCFQKSRKVFSACLSNLYRICLRNILFCDWVWDNPCLRLGSLGNLVELLLLQVSTTIYNTNLPICKVMDNMEERMGTIKEYKVIRWSHNCTGQPCCQTCILFTLLCRRIRSRPIFS